MKKTFLYALASIVMVSCSGNGNKAAADSDSITDSPENTEEIRETSNYLLTKEGVGSIWIGQSINDVPDSIAGLYTYKEMGASPDAVTIEFKGSQGGHFVAYDFGEGKIDVINLIDSSVKVDAPGGEFGIGDKFKNVLQLPGVEEEWSGYDNVGTWYWKWNGLWFAPSQESISESLSRRLYQSEQAPTSVDFDDNVTIGFIGTGLPY
ncbi:MAG: hypothetical protein K2G52_05295 [Muribaculaceae bacterium]|nr:hypothetical protein [Muribaculaceae bacterium]